MVLFSVGILSKRTLTALPVLAALLVIGPLHVSFAKDRIIVSGITAIPNKIESAEVEPGGALVLSGMATDTIVVAVGGNLTVSGMANVVVVNGGSVTASGMIHHLQMNGGQATVSGMVQSLHGHGRVSIHHGAYINGKEYEATVTVDGDW